MYAVTFFPSPLRRVFHGVAILGRRPLLRLNTADSNLLVAYEAHQGLVPGRSSYTDTDQTVVMLTLNSLAPRREAITTIFKVFGMARSRESNPGPPVP